MSFAEIWSMIAPYIAGISIGGVVVALITGTLSGVLKGAFSRTVQKLNIEKITQETVDKSLEKLKGIAFSSNIQPLVENELIKVNELAKRVSEKELAKVQERLDNLLKILQSLKDYFDDSPVILQEKKDKVQASIDKTLLNAPTSAEFVIVEETPEEVAIVQPEPRETPKTRRRTVRKVVR